MCAVCAGGQRNSSHPGPGDSRLRGGGDAGGLSGHADTGVEAPDAECELQIREHHDDNEADLDGLAGSKSHRSPCRRFRSDGTMHP